MSSAPFQACSHEGWVRVDGSLHRLHPVHRLQEGCGAPLLAWQVLRAEVAEARHLLPRTHVSPDHAARFMHRVGKNLQLVLEHAAWLARHVDALAVHVELPAVIDATQTPIFVTAEEQRYPPMRAVLVDQADAALRVAKRHEVLAEEAYPQRCAIRLRMSLLRHAGVQYRRRRFPIGVPGRVCVISSLSCFDSIFLVLPLRPSMDLVAS